MATSPASMLICRKRYKTSECEVDSEQFEILNDYRKQDQHSTSSVQHSSPKRLKWLEGQIESWKSDREKLVSHDDAADFKLCPSPSGMGVFPLISMPPVMYNVLDFLKPEEIAKFQIAGRLFNCCLQEYISFQIRTNFSCIKLGKVAEAHTTSILVKPKASVLSFMTRCALLLHLQSFTHPSPRCIEDIQSSVTPPDQQVNIQIRSILVDWMIEVAVEYNLSTTVLHSSVNLLDRCLSRFMVPRRKLQLLGCVCLMLESQRPASAAEYSMKVEDVMYICDSQYDATQVGQMCKVAVSSTFHKRIRTPPTTFCFLCQYLSVIHQSGPQRENAQEPMAGIEHVVLAIFLSDLSLLDYGMLQFYPSTVAISVVFLSRLMAHYFSKRGLLVSPFAVIEPGNREVRRLVGSCREFIPTNLFSNSEPLGSIFIQDFLKAAPVEALAVKACTTRLWNLHNDFNTISNLKETTDQVGLDILSQHAHMLKGLQEKYAPKGSIRSGAWRMLGVVPRNVLEEAISEYLDLYTS